jgi:tetratricopeptide (TPR) repeat protein
MCSEGDKMNQEAPSVLDKADAIMDEAVDKAGELLCTKPRIAEIILKQLLKCDPEHLAGLQLLGLCKHRLGENAEAVEIIQTALELDPSNADNFNNLGLAYAGMNQHERAIEAINKAIELKPSQFLFKNNVALQYRSIGDYDSAIRCMREAISVEPKPQLWLNLGSIYGELRDIEEAERCFRSALDLDPEYPAAHVDMAFVYHLRGDWVSGFCEYEWRFYYYPQMRFYLDNFNQDKLWHGVEDLRGKRVLIYGEQGMGDIIMFARYAKEIKARGATVIMQVPQCLEDLMKRVEGVDEVNIHDIFSNKGPGLGEYDYQFSLMSAPHLLKSSQLDGSSYIEPATTAFKDHMKKEYQGTYNVGIVWAGNPAHPHDQKRSIPLKYFKPLQEIRDIKLFSLQMDVRKRQYGSTVRNMSAEQAGVHDHCQEKFHGDKTIVDYCEGCDDMKLTDLTKMIQSFEDTATILAGLDLVICCDTATGHLAGAMGIPVWMLIPYNPDWRWTLDGQKSPWYQSMRLFRQRKRDDWQGVMEEVMFALANEEV